MTQHATQHTTSPGYARSRARVPRRHRGQALVEFLTIAAALVPLFLLMPVLAKYMDIAQATQAASRYAAFEATVHHGGSVGGLLPSSQLGTEVRRRFFSNPDAPVKTNDAAGDFQAHRNLFWRGPTGDPLIASQQDVATSLTPTFRAPDRTLGLRGHTSLEDSAVQRADVSVALLRMPAFLRSYAPLNQLDLRISRTTSVLPNAWMASGPAAVRENVNGINHLTRNVEALQTVADLVVEPFELFQNEAPQFNRLERWDDVVPLDRLVNARP